MKLPPIYYMNLQHRESRREYMESQFKKYKIRKWKRVNSSIFSAENFPEWKELLLDSHYKTHLRYMSVLLNRAETIADFLFNCESDTCLLMEDDISFCTQKYWGFEWDEFMRYLPHNWDCVQLHIIGEKYLPVSLTRWKLQNHSAACILINKRYAQKFVDMYMERGKWRFLHRFGYSPDLPEYHYHSGDFVPYQVGTTYSFPLFVTNSKFISDGYMNQPNYLAKKSDIIALNWWKNKRSDYLTSQLMYLDKPITEKL